MKKNTKKHKKKKLTNNPISLLVKRYTESTSILKFLLLFFFLIILFYILYSTPFFSTFFLKPFIGFQAYIANFFLNVMGFETITEGGIIQNDQNSVNVGRGCDGLEPMAFLVLGMVILPVTLKTKVIGVLFGLLTLLLLNILRIMGLFLANAYAESWFETLHLHGGFALFIFFALIIWLIWANWAIKKMKVSG